MPSKNRALYINLAICIVILLGFLVISALNHTSNREVVEADIENISRLTSENIYSRIESLLAQPINVSLTMANDTFLKNWLEQETAHLDDPAYIWQLQQYLIAYKDEYAYDSVVVISEKSGRYYHYSGIAKTISPENPLDSWYYACTRKREDYKINIDMDYASNNTPTIFADSKIKGTRDMVMGVVGIGLLSDRLQAILRDYEKEFNIQAFLIDASGALQISARETKFAQRNLFQERPFAEFKDSILKNQFTKETRWYSNHGIDGFYVTRYIPNLNWYLIVIKDTSELNRKFVIQFLQRMGIIIAIAALVAYIVTRVVQRYNRIILQLATNDVLTGVRNRVSYEETLTIYNETLDRKPRIGMGIFDLNGLKHINDTLGHSAGDAYIRNCTTQLCLAFPGSIFRIGGDEFATFFTRESPEEVQAMHATLLENIAQTHWPAGLKPSIAFGASFYDPKTDYSLADVFNRADDNMYQQKKKMKDQQKPAP